MISKKKAKKPIPMGIRVPPELYATLKTLAERDSRTVNSLITKALTAYAAQEMASV